MKEVFIISSMQIIHSKSAGSRRILNIAKSLALGNVNVYLCSLTQISKQPLECTPLFPNIFTLASTGKNKNQFLQLFYFIFSLSKFIRQRKSESVIYLYPTTITLNDFVFLIYFKLIKKYRFYCDINELRVTNLYTSIIPENIISKFVFYIKYPFVFLLFKINEIQALIYDGIVVISTNLEKYYSGYTKRIIRIPILCDVPKSINCKPILYKSGTFKICFSGTISYKKEGFDLLFKTLSLVNLKKDVELHMYGSLIDNEENKKLKRLIENYNLSKKVFYHGNIEPENLLPEFNKYDLLILPRPLNKQTYYGFSTKLSEYLISGVPVLLTSVSDNTLFIRDNYNGFVVTPGCIQEMVSKIIKIIESYGMNSSIIAQNAFKTAQENFDYKLYTQIFINFFFNENI